MRTLIRRIRARAARCCAIGLALLGLQCAAGAAPFDRAYWPRATFTFRRLLSSFDAENYDLEPVHANQGVNA